MEKQGFDMTVTHRDPKTGVVIRKDPYRLRILKGADGGRMKLFERPVGSGNLYSRWGEPRGRWVESTKKGESAKHEPDAKHIAFEAPLTEDQKVARTLMESQAKNAALEQELAQLRAEAKKKEKGV